MTEAVLTIDALDVSYGEIRALRDVSIAIRESEVVAVIGANGAGKTTLLKTISGLVRPTTGTIRFRGLDLIGRRTDQIVAMGLVHCPEGRAVLGRMSVLENLEMGAFRRGRDPEIRRDLLEIFALFPQLEERRDQSAHTLSGGEQQMLAIGRALMARPALIMIDEPSLGLAPILVAEVFRVIDRLKAQGLTVLLVEQNARQALKCADRAYVLETGQVSIEGAAGELLADARVQAAYLGKARDK